MFSIDNADGSDIFFYFDREDIPFQSGPCDDIIAEFYFRHKDVITQIPESSLDDIIKPCGGWEAEDIAEMDIDEKYQIVLWIAAGDARENEDAYPEEDTVEGVVSTY